MFIVVCKWADNSKVLESIEAVKKYHPNELVAVVDSDSSDKSYFNNLPKDVMILDIANKNYLEGALWYCYNHFPNEDFFYLIQDSMILLKNIDELKNRDFTHLSYFPFHYNEQYGHGVMREYSINQINKTKYQYLEPNYAVFGSTLYIKRSLLDKIKEKGFDTVLPTNKMEHEALERLWAVVLTQEGYDIEKNGLVRNTSFGTNPYFVKYWLGRQ